MNAGRDVTVKSTSNKQSGRIRFKLDLFDTVMMALVVIATFLLLVPLFIVIASSFHPAEYFSFPPQGFSLKWYGEFFSRSLWVQGMKNTFYVATATAIFSVIVGTCASVAVVNRKFIGKTAVDFLMLSPQLIAPIIIGIALLMGLSAFGIRGTYTSLVIAHSLWTVPLVFMIMQAVVKNLDPCLPAAAKDLGAGPFKSFFEVTLPLIKPGIISSFLIAFVLSMHEFIISLFLTTPRTMTLPVIIWTSLRFELSPIVGSVSVLMMVVVLIVLLIIARLIGLEKIRFGA